MACVSKQNPDCPNCNKNGLAILPVRYAVVPNSVDAMLPPGLGEKVVNVKLNQHKYALRTLRQGFLYLYYEKHARGSQIKWEAYSVSKAGTLWKQISTNTLTSVNDEPACSRSGHHIQASIISIEDPAKCGLIWIAFSEHSWSTETFKAFETDVALRNRRMQTFDPALWISAAAHQHGMAATEASLNEIIEYKNGFALGTLGAGSGGIVPAISTADGTHVPGVLKKQTTRYPLCVRRDDKMSTVDLMTLVGQTSVGTVNPPIAIALWDCVGIAHELNGFRNDTAGWIGKYCKEHELKIGAATALEGLKKALQERAGKQARAASDLGTFAWSADSTKKRLAGYLGANPGNAAGYRRQSALCKYWESDATKKVPSHIARRREYAVGQNETEWQKSMTAIDQAVAQDSTPNIATGKSHVERREARSKQWEDDAVAGAWPKYESHIDTFALTAFNAKYAAFLLAADELMDGQTKDLVAWMESDFLIDALAEFHPENARDGASFEDQIGTALMGIGSTLSGKEKIDAWVNEMKATPKNLLWRAIALNQTAGTQALNEALAHAVGPPKPLTEEAWDLVAKEIKWNKIFDLGKKSLGFFNTNAKAIDPKAGIKHVERTHGLEKILSTVGFRFLQPFATGIDSVNYLTVQALLTIRAGVEPKAALAVIANEVRSHVADRDTLIRRLRNHNHYLSESAKIDHEKKKTDWKNLLKDAEVVDAKKGTLNAARDARLALVVAMFETFNLYKASKKLGAAPEDASAQALLLAAQLSVASAAMDVLGTYVKGLHSLKDLSASFQALKFVGGGFSACASFIGGIDDLRSLRKSITGSNYRMAALYGIRGGFQFVSFGLTSLLALSYCSPIIETFGKRVAVVAIKSGAGWLLSIRAALFLASIEVSIFLLAVSMVIWKFEDDLLQKWCDRCAFGQKRKSEKMAFTSAEKQGAELLDAVASVR